MQFLEGSIHFFLIEAAFVRQANVAACFLEEFDTAQGSLQIVDGAAEGGLGNAQPCRGGGIMLRLGQYGKIAKNVVVHGRSPGFIDFIYK